jgi:phosphatidylserine decarboxylase
MESALEPMPMMKPGPLRLAREGYPFLIIFAALGVGGGFLFWPIGLAFGLLFAFTLYFFRDPERVPPADPELLVSPADGTILKVEELEGPYLSGTYRKISIFMSPLDVHVNAIPCNGTVREIAYHPGKFFVASLDKASIHNERNAVVLETPGGFRVAFVQIAGLVARRIVCYARSGRAVQRGERYGMIRFGSRMEVCLPPQWPVLVQPGDKVFAGQSPLVRMKEKSS